MAENLLSGVLSGFIEAEATRQLFDYFFFIRYRDEGGHHLRLRFFNKDLTNQLSLVKEVMQALQPFIDNGSIENVLLDSYSRETERYGETLIEQTEQLFYNDSVAIIKLIGLLTDSGDPEKYRPLIALRGVDALLSDFNFSIAEKVLLLKQMAASYFAEFGGGLPLQRQLSNKYRKYQQTIFSHMDTGQDTKNEIEEAVSILKFRSSQNAPIIKDIMSISSPHHQQGLYDLLQSYIHMFINRLFVASQRKYELVIYHFLDRYYHSQVAIDKKNGKG
jgi:thiopeptide-type bacteriocin biosynthesis protein